MRARAEPGGAEAEFDAFFRAHREALVAQGYVMSGDIGTAQDLAQEALARAWSNWGKISRYDKPEAWVHKVLHNLAVSDWRRTKSGRRLVAAQGPITGGEAVPGPEPDHFMVVAELQRLPKRQARALVLHDALGYRVAEIAEELRVPEGTVKAWLSRARATIARRLAQEGHAGAPAPTRADGQDGGFDEPA